MAPDEYREQFGLNRSTALASPALRRKLSARLGPLLAMQPAENPLLARQGVLQRRHPNGLDRLQARLSQSEAKHWSYAERPRPPKSVPLANAEVRPLALQRIAELRQDPAWVAS